MKNILKPINIGHYRNEKNETWTLGDCPKCGGYISENLMSVSMEYCRHCGQLLDGVEKSDEK